MGKVLVIKGGSVGWGTLCKFRLHIQGHPFVEIAGDDEAGPPDQEAFIVTDGAIVITDQFFIVGDVVITQLGIAANADFFIPFFSSGSFRLNNGFLSLLIGFCLEPFFFGELAFLVENVLKSSLGHVGLDDDPKADHTGDGREPRSFHSNTSGCMY